MTTWRRRAQLVVAVGAVGTLLLGGQALAAPGGNGWTSAGGDRANTRFAANESKISAANVSGLVKKWEFTTGGDVSATPAVDGQRVYFPDWAGNLYAVNRATGKQVWRTSISAYTGLTGDKARATPAVTDTALILGNQGPFGGGGAVFAVDKNTGALLWKTQVESHPAAIITQSATVFDGVVYIGTASQEEAFSAIVPDYPCCSFRGSMNALDAATGRLLWKTYMTPVGYPGNAVWGSSPAIDTKRRTVYIATGNNYDAPPGVLACVAAASTPAGRLACIDAADHFDSILALDMRTGAIKWATRALDFDAWTVDCIPFIGDGSNCPEPAGPDFDFGQAPNLYTVASGPSKGRELVGAGQKSGQYWALDPSTGAVVWVTQAGPGGTAGGLQWGSATDGRRVYTANANSNLVPWNGATTGVWSGLDAATGQLLWETRPSQGGSTAGPVTTANGVVFGCSLDALGHMYALNAATGAELWRFASGGSCLSGAAISNGTLYWGSGYSNFGFGTPNTKLFAFGL
ncbi:PQQ-binding-like beta-propeller repeat protein [Oryzobacter telluris]|uniref:outer membrane protein assembly factor BamB family protein n=1 Tax=Oryzobacter telluris TaxID=3149179 RepID=UPI00370DCDBA